VNAPGRARILIVDDEPSFRRGVARSLVPDFDVLTAEDGAAALGLLATTRVDAMLLDLIMPRMSGLEVLAAVKASHPDVEVVMTASHDELDAAVAAVRAGAYGFLVRPIEPAAAVAIALERAVERRRLAGRARALEERIEQHEQLGEIIAGPGRMQDAYRKALGAATASSAVLLEGERGTGRELVARAIHRRSMRAERRFVVVDCGAIPEARVEEELFGVERYASDESDEADRDRRSSTELDARPCAGLVETADKGTLFLDEVGSLPLASQARLLRALTHGEIARAGGAEPRRVDVRVIAATCAGLRERVQAGLFRQDLYYRLSVILIELPPLRQRKEDVVLLANHFLHRLVRKHARQVRRIGTEATRLLRDHPWPGNVRELESAIEHAVLVARGDALMPADLPAALSGRRLPERRAGADAISFEAELCDLPYAEAKERAVETFDRAYVERLLRRTDNNLSEAARQAGMDRSNFRRLKKKVESADDNEAPEGDGA
jgi:DNA-binding NtrC family response regulator